ncbi:efflux RND transporter periplasmic adaptor subunit (plasmid) [Paroceanicella profunda]|uniref:Efflux RND transporter periplasmic adaptor subunit n=1 Tax=Paroceanicella profunda TaxID=2579971 RepID=A0A5B8FZD4_9RHOB|nr:efflux RND transporter periplasmic adaptor subunit [Paroceanicella profunda]QDL94286.1 efflux RND transporter periplasmic adaptor subunit [Paroceanicella profunda]
MTFRLSGSALLAAALFLSPAILRAQQAAPVVTGAKPVVRDIVEVDEFAGRFEAVDTVDIRARVSGYLDTVHFTDGALVEKGDLLFTIDQRAFRSAVNQARADVDVAQSRLSFAKLEFERAQPLERKGNLSTSALDDRQREYDAARASLAGAQAALERAELDLEFSEVRAPFPGRIDRRLISAGNLVQADSTVLTSIVTRDPIDFYFNIDERRFLAYARDLRGRDAVINRGGGLKVVVKLADGREDPVEGVLNFAENRIDDATGTMRLRARFANPDGILQPGMFGRISVPGSLPHRGVLLPDEAIASDQGRRVVFVVAEDGSVSTLPVRTGPRIDGYRVIRDGLTGDETVIVNGLMRVRPGATVTVEMETLPDALSPDGLPQ